MNRIHIMAVIFALGAASGSAQVLEDFESYGDDSELRAVWNFSPKLDTTTGSPGSGSQSIQIDHFHQSEPGQGRLTYTVFQEAIDVSSGHLQMWVIRDAGTVSPTGFVATLVDISGTRCDLDYIPVAETGWRKISFDPTVCSSGVGLDLTQVTELWIGISNRSSGNGELRSNIDQIGISLFDDGFESGATDAWSSATGGS